MTLRSYRDVFKPEDITLAQLWTLFAGAVLPADASPMQREEMRKAFFSGFLECFKLMNDYATTLPEDECTALFSRLQAEGMEHFERMMAVWNGRAG